MRATPISERFHQGYSPEPNSGCWLWEGCGTGGKWDYGTIKADRHRRMLLAHRVSWELVNGEIVDGIEVCHRCDMPRCVNPDHLFLGTRQDNMDDCVAKRRHARGEGHARAKLDEVRVETLRQACASGMTRRAAAEHFGVANSTVTYAVNRFTWKG